MKFPTKEWKQITLHCNTEIFIHTHEARACRLVITFMLYTTKCLQSESLTGLFTLLQTFRRPLQFLILQAAIHLLPQNPQTTYVSSDCMTVNRSTNINAKLNAFSFFTFKGLELSAFQLLLSVSQISVSFTHTPRLWRLVPHN